jgi:hypothetical protein
MDSVVNNQLQNTDLSCDAWSTFSSSQNGFSIDYPSNWTALELPNGNHGDSEVIALLVAPNHILPAVEIARKSFSMTVDEVVNWGEERITKRFKKDVELGDVKKIDKNDSIIAKRIYTSGLRSENPLNSYEFYIAREDDSLILSFNATQTQFEKVKTCFDTMIDSFEPIN